MAERRIKVPKDKADFIESLLYKSDQGRGPFESKAQVMAFAAACGIHHGKPLPLTKGTGEPIRYEIFEREGFDTMINIIAVCFTNDIKVLNRNDEMEDRRAAIFEEFANRGLELLQNKLKGEIDYTQALLLLLMRFLDSKGKDVLEDLTGIFG
jgi:dnd system-associated protein 4